MPLYRIACLILLACTTPAFADSPPLPPPCGNARYPQKDETNVPVDSWLWSSDALAVVSTSGSTIAAGDPTNGLNLGVLQPNTQYKVVLSGDNGCQDEPYTFTTGTGLTADLPTISVEHFVFQYPAYSTCGALDSKRNQYHGFSVDGSASPLLFRVYRRSDSSLSLLKQSRGAIGFSIYDDDYAKDITDSATYEFYAVNTNGKESVALKTVQPVPFEHGEEPFDDCPDQAAGCSSSPRPFAGFLSVWMVYMFVARRRRAA